MNEKAVDGPDPDSKEDTTGQSSVTVEEATLRDNRDSKDEINVVDDEKDEEEEEEEEESRVVNEEAAVSPGPYTKDETREQQTVKTFSWAASCIDFNQSVDPYGAVMWPGALALCSFLENNRDMVNLEDKQVLELGSGTGLVAIVASLLGAKVTATDLPNFLGNLRANVMRNIRGRSRHIPQICPLTWSFDVGRIYPSHLHRFDFVLAADVVYHHHYLDELLATMSHFCHPRTTIIWANKLRIVTDIEFIEKFKKEFDTTLLAEDGDMKIFMGKFKM
uniref:Si:ch73-244f7.3 n=1 Tax=Neogobius melanostomus TaxID=47308 RepID=A0A8C6TXC5_9GOBI